MPDVAGGVAAFGRALRTQGVPVAPDRIALAARAVTFAQPATRDALYWTLRASLLTARGQADAFDRVFGSHLDGLVDPADERGDPADEPLLDPGQRAGSPPPGRPRGPLAGGGDGRAVELAGRAGGRRARRRGTAHRAGRRQPGRAPRRARLRLADGGRGADGARPGRPLPPRHAAAPHPAAAAGPRRPARRPPHDPRRPAPVGGDPVPLARRRRVERPRRLVLLLDVSASMEAYSRAFLHLLHGAVAGADAEAFVFATRLTRLTRALAGRNPEAALQRAARAAPDAGGGTRIGEALAAFNNGYGRRGMARGAVVVILSDGWETGDVGVVDREMTRLRPPRPPRGVGQPARRGPALRPARRRHGRRPAARRRASSPATRRGRWRRSWRRSGGGEPTPRWCRAARGRTRCRRRPCRREPAHRRHGHRVAGLAAELLDLRRRRLDVVAVEVDAQPALAAAPR